MAAPDSHCPSTPSPATDHGEKARPGKITDPVEILRLVERALLLDPLLPTDDPGQGFVIVMSVEPAESARTVFFFDGILSLPGEMSRRNPAFAKELVESLREVTRDESGERWRTWIVVYNGQTGEFTHTRLWPGEDASWNVIDGSVDREAAAQANPLDPALLDTPFSATGAHWLHAAYARRLRVPEDPIITVDEFDADRLAQGWRIYRRADCTDTAGELTSIRDAAGGIVFLVADSTAVTHTTQEVDSHDELLAALQCEREQCGPRPPLPDASS